MRESYVRHLEQEVERLNARLTEEKKTSDGLVEHIKGLDAELLNTHRKLARTESRLKHLFLSDFIESYDCVDACGKYVLDISDADKIHEEYLKLKLEDINKAIATGRKSMTEVRASINNVLCDCWVRVESRKIAARFHRWIEREEYIITFKGSSKEADVGNVIKNYERNKVIVDPHGVVSKTCKITNTYALVECPDGSMKLVIPEEIQFINYEHL